MRRVAFGCIAIAVALTTLAGCATNFTAPGVRAEIARQTGAEPRDAFEVSAGPATMALLRRIMSDEAGPEGSLTASRVTSFELAFYELPSRPGAPPVDFTLIPVRGWEPTLRYRSPEGSGMVLVRPAGDSVGDLVVLAADGDGAIFGRVRGTLPRELPATLAVAVREGGPEAIKRKLDELD